MRSKRSTKNQLTMFTHSWVYLSGCGNSWSTLCRAADASRMSGLRLRGFRSARGGRLIAKPAGQAQKVFGSLEPNDYWTRTDAQPAQLLCEHRCSHLRRQQMVLQVKLPRPLPDDMNERRLKTIRANSHHRTTRVVQEVE